MCMDTIVLYKHKTDGAVDAALTDVASLFVFCLHDIVRLT